MLSEDERGLPTFFTNCFAILAEGNQQWCGQAVLSILLRMLHLRDGFNTSEN